MHMKSRDPVKFDSPTKSTAIACGHVESGNGHILFLLDIEELDK